VRGATICVWEYSFSASFRDGRTGVIMEALVSELIKEIDKKNAEIGRLISGLKEIGRHAYDHIIVVDIVHRLIANEDGERIVDIWSKYDNAYLKVKVSDDNVPGCFKWQKSVVEPCDEKKEEW
jgi:hypothetical protein